MMANIDKQPPYTPVITINIIPWGLKEFWVIKRVLLKLVEQCLPGSPGLFPNSVTLLFVTLCWKN